ncbi:MAG: SPFH domain-containing protein [Verrucomicrobiota bacterium]
MTIEPMLGSIIPILGGSVAAAILVFGLIAWVASRYKRCPPDRILVVFGKTGAARTGGSSTCYHGGGAFVWPVIQSHEFLDLTPIPIEILLEGALSQQNIRVNTPSTFTVGISTEPGVMQNAAERLLGLTLVQVQELAKDIIFGQMRVVIATMPIEEINADRDKMIDNISNGVEVELKKVGLRLINVNIQDITDESGYIDALGQEAAARAINEAKIKVAEQERDGEIGKANAEQSQRIQVAAAQATAVEGENEAKVTVARSDAARREAEAEANRKGSAAERVKSAAAQQEAYAAEELAERERAKREEATQYANVVVPAEIEQKRIAVLAEAEAEKTRRESQGEADGIRSVKQAEADGIKADLVAKAEAMKVEAEGIQAQLDAKAEGIQNLYEAAGRDSDFASLMMILEQLPQLVAEQVKAVSNLKIDKVTVWDGGANGDGKNATSEFISNMVKSLPPLHELTDNVGVKLPDYLGKIEDTEEVPTVSRVKPAAEGDARASNDGGGNGTGTT